MAKCVGIRFGMGAKREDRGGYTQRLDDESTAGQQAGFSIVCRRSCAPEELIMPTFLVTPRRRLSGRGGAVCAAMAGTCRPNCSDEPLWVIASHCGREPCNGAEQHAGTY
jgi:hypothetical protein